MKAKTGKFVALSAVAVGFGLASQAVTITATPGRDYVGATITTDGAEGSGTVTIADYKNGGAQVFTTNVSGNVSFFVAGLAADGVYDITATYGSATATKRLYQGEDGYDEKAWFAEMATSPTDARWTGGKAPTVTEERFVFTDDEDDLVQTAYTPENSQADRLAIFEMDMTFGGPLPDAELPTLTDAQGAVRVVESDSKYYFSYYANGAWTMSTAVEVSLNANYVIRVTLDKMNGTVSYDAKLSTASDFTNLYKGSSTSVASANVADVSFAGEGTVGYINGNSNTDKADAYVCEAGGTKYKSVGAAILDSQTSIALLWDASWFAPETGDAYAISGSKSLEVLGGKIAASTTLPADITLVGGKYTSAALEAKVAVGYRMAARVTSDAYTHEVLSGSEKIADDEKIYPVTSGSTTVDIAFSKTELVSKGICDGTETDVQVQEKLNAAGENKNPAWENVVLGLSNTDASSVPVAMPVQSTDANAVTFKLGGVTIDPKYNANVYYKVNTYDSTWTKTDTSSPALASDTIAVALPSSGVQYYTLEVDAAGAH